MKQVSNTKSKHCEFHGQNTNQRLDFSFSKRMFQKHWKCFCFSYFSKTVLKNKLKFNFKKQKNKKIYLATLFPKRFFNAINIFSLQKDKAHFLL